MSKRKKKHTAPRGQRGAVREPDANLTRALGRAQELVDAGKPREAVALLKPLVADHPHVPPLQATLGIALFQAGEPWRALTHYERAAQFGHQEELSVALATLYLDLGLHAYALQDFRDMQRACPHGTFAAPARDTIAALEQEIKQLTADHGVAASQAPRGCHSR